MNILCHHVKSKKILLMVSVWTDFMSSAAKLGLPKYNKTCSMRAAEMCKNSTPWEESARRNDSRTCG